MTTATRPRLDSVDLLRGIVMVLMALDHTRDFALAATFQMSPTDLSKTTAAIFFTRWVTHFCAPIFVLLAGTGSYLQLQRGKSRAELARFLVTRGLWLVVLEFTAVRCLWLWDFDYAHYLGMAQVIWAIGVSMFALGLLVRWVSPGTLGVIGLVIVSLHNLLDRFPSAFWFPGSGPAPSALATVWKLLHGAGFTQLGAHGPLLLTGYALIPWFGVMLVGYGLGTVYTWEPEIRQRFLVRAGIAVIIAFIAIRAVNQYGDPVPRDPTDPRWILSFINTTKYPPSLDFLLMTLGPALILLAAFEHIKIAPLITFGRVPLFFYLLQWPGAKGATFIASVLAHKPTHYLFGQPPLNGPIPDNAGFSLGVIYVLWALVILALYPLCVWYAGVKQRHRDWSWLSYL
ncbi:MAG TPA: heparan-alpha-glucosaminide N-acetyltransferase domain-containing protein [Gemmatimonadaceae bacterium]|nr:heparan-alpha-glucosaminide N-acetyltransferase domain-containing protein [Gemmatimonadaceae bacterium]